MDEYDDMSDVCGRVTFQPLGKPAFSRIIHYNDTMEEIAAQIEGADSFTGKLKLVAQGPSKIYVSLDIPGGGKRAKPAEDIIIGHIWVLTNS